MNGYAQITLKAAQYIRHGSAPRAAWEEASSEVYPKGSAAQIQACPRNAFLGLYGINRTSLNAQYAVKARKYLEEHAAAGMTAQELWAIVLEGESKTHNGQMDVVLALYANV